MPDKSQREEFADLRLDYGKRKLTQDDLHPDPIEQFRRWFEEARQACAEPNAMALATCSPDGQPSARIVLLKGVGRRGFVFYTGYDSRKGQELAGNPRAAAVLHWESLERQVRIVGEVTRASCEESEAYFRSRPRGSQLSAYISKQSQPVTREQLEAEWRALDEKYTDEEIPFPENWGGFWLAPREVEFWQGRPNRLHDRFVYLATDQGWTTQRLAP